MVAARNQSHIKIAVERPFNDKYATSPLYAGKKYIKLLMSQTGFLGRL
jgi:hypothetical protein